MRVDLLEYQEEYKNLMEEIDDLEQGINLSLAVDSDLLQVGMEEAMYTMNNTCNPKKFHLELNSGVERNPCIFTEPPYSFNKNWIRKVIQINFNSLNSNGSEPCTLPVFTELLNDLISAGKATVLYDHAVMLTSLPCTCTGYGELNISIFGTHIRGRWKRTILMENNLNGNRQSFLNETYCIGLGGQLNGNTANGTKGLAVAPKPMGQHGLPVVDEVPENGKTPPAGPDSLILAKSLGSGRRSVDDMQRSLSRENSRDNSPQFSRPNKRKLDLTQDEDEAKDEHTTDATRLHEAMWETSLSKVEPEEELSSFDFTSGKLELVDTSILQGDPG